MSLDPVVCLLRVGRIYAERVTSSSRKPIVFYHDSSLRHHDSPRTGEVRAPGANIEEEYASMPACTGSEGLQPMQFEAWMIVFVV